MESRGPPELPREEVQYLLARQFAKFKAMLQGHPIPDQYRILNISPYKVHQRLASSMRVDRILLAADAAHLCNPVGGMGLSGGIVDVGNLYDCLRGIYEGQADDSLLDNYSEIRRKIWKEVTDPVSSGNLLRFCALDLDTAGENEPFFQNCAKGQKDPEFARKMLKVRCCIQPHPLILFLI